MPKEDLVSHPSHCSREAVAKWFSQHFDEYASLRVTVDREEVKVVVELTDGSEGPALAPADAKRRIKHFYESTSSLRDELAERAEQSWERKVAWGAHCSGVEVMFNQLSSPVMTRLRIEERLVLDTLIDGGVARSRSEALAWCVRRVAHHEGEWIERLRDAMIAVENVRAEGPGASPTTD